MIQDERPTHPSDRPATAAANLWVPMLLGAAVALAAHIAFAPESFLKLALWVFFG